MFTKNGTPQFLTFVSYLDAMRRHDHGGMADDLAFIKEKGFDGIQIFRAGGDTLTPADAME